MTSGIYALYENLTRRKTYDTDSLQTSLLKRCLTVFDLTVLGIGSTLGTGTYILTGQVARDTAGPSVALSFAIAAVASILAGLCYAELGARAPRAGSAYTYTYVSVGEIMAFIIGWNMILEYVIGAASTARALSTYFDSLINYAMSNFFAEHLALGSKILAPYADLFALGICLVVTALLVMGVKESALLNIVCTAVNLTVVAIVVIAGSTQIDIHNWNISPNEVHNITNTTGPIGKGGFFPFGFSGTIAGAATCFYAFVGFDIVATTGEETKNPQRAIPMAIFLTLLVCTIVYCSVAVILTLMVPYYLIDPNAALTQAFAYVQLPAFEYIIGIGAITGIFASLLGSLFPLPRVLYAIASDGLIFRSIAWIHPRLQTPVIATVIGGVGAGIMALLFDLQALVEMMSIGTLLAYSLVAISVLFLRYRPVEDPLINSDEQQVVKPIYVQLFKPTHSYPTITSSRITKYAIILLALDGFIICAMEIFAGHLIVNVEPVPLIFFILFLNIEIIFIIVIARQPQNTKSLYFETPFVPYIPIFSVLFNSYLMLNLSPVTWIRFGIWMLAGFLIYGFYGFWHSSQRFVDDTQRLLSGSTNNPPLIDSS